jgi:hypothetical protein
VFTRLHPRGDTTRAAAASSAATAGGIGIGAAASGVLAQWAPAPLSTPYVVLGGVAVLLIVAILTVRPTPR